MLWRAIAGGAALVPSGASRPSPGDAQVADLSISPGSHHALQHVEQAPWAPVIVLLGKVRLTPGLATVLVGLRSPAAFLEWARPAVELAPAQLATALRSRRAPDAAAIASYLQMRNLRSWFVGEVHDCLSEATGSSTDRRSTLYRRLVAEGPLTPRDWRALLDIVRFVHHLPDHGVERAAYSEGRDPRTMRSRLERLTGSTIAEARFRFGWEWALEDTLRRWGYVREDSPGVGRSAAFRSGLR